jgi:hypothetical protein
MHSRLDKELYIQPLMVVPVPRNTKLYKCQRRFLPAPFEQKPKLELAVERIKFSSF